MAGHTLLPLPGFLQYLQGALLLVVLMATVRLGQAECNIAAVEACLDTIYTSAAPCTDQSLADLDTCFDTHLGPVTCRTADMGTLRLNRTLVHARCTQTCMTPPTPPNPCGSRGTCKRNGDTWDFMCECHAGWTGPRCDDDIDECADSSLNDCDLHATCRNKRGTFSCICESGFVFNKQTRACDSYNPCEYNTLECEQSCTAPSGVAACQCHPGFIQNGNQCTGDGTCSESNKQFCMSNGAHGCYRTQTGFNVCFCKLGYDGNEGKECTFRNQCLDNPCEMGTCRAPNGRFQCGCPSGSELQEDKRTCIECDDDHYGEQCASVCNCGDNYVRCGPTGCTDCKAGWTGTGCTVSIKDGPCTDDTDCGSGTCVNMADGEYECQCNPGAVHLYGHSQSICQESDECAKAFDNDCDMMCHNTASGYECSCYAGYELSADGYSCLNINDCEGHNCAVRCVDGNSTFTCACNTGYKLNDDGISCGDINECMENTHGCDQVCDNNVGSFTCSCNSDFTLQPDMKTCNEINPCDNHDCAHQCVRDSATEYHCTCDTGYVVKTTDPKACIDVNECDDGDDECEDGCTNMDGGYTCSCPDGKVLKSDQRTCRVLLLCETNTHGCAWMCKGDQCTCDTGYTLNADGKTCDDVDECDTNMNSCQQTCMDTDGSYICDCNNGYTLNSDGKTCDDIDECTVGSHNCEHDCSNTPPGSFTCTCPAGSVLNPDGRTCEVSNFCQENNCEHSCTNGQCTCKTGYFLNSDNINCDDINECSGDHGCGDGCMNTPGTYQCVCSGDNMVLGTDGKSCVEGCSMDCGTGATCRLDGGQAVCDCDQDGFSHNSNDNACLDINECADDALNECSERTVCINSAGAYRCACRTGFEPIPSNLTNCTDIDECQDADFCVNSTHCINRIGSFLCPCNSHIHDNTTIVINVNMFGDEDDPDVILPPLKVLLANNDAVQSHLNVSDFDIYHCQFLTPGQTPSRRLLQTDRELSFALVADQSLTDDQRGDIVLSIINELSTPTNLTVGQDVVTITDPAIVSKGKPVTIYDRCTYFDLIDYCGVGRVCNIVNTSTTCVPVTTAATTGRPHKTLIVMATSGALAGFILLVLVALGAYICKRQKDTNDYYRKRGSKLRPRGLNGASQSPSHPASLHINKTPRHDTGIRMQYQFYKDSVSRPSYVPTIHAGTMRGWAGEGSHGWAPSVGRQEAPNPKPPPVNNDSLRDVALAQFDKEEGAYNALTGDQGSGSAVFQAS